jgi:fatty-acyl-CoA synthase
MGKPRTLPEALESAARTGGGLTYREEHGKERFQPYAEVLVAALRIAGSLAERGLRRGDRVALILPHPESFLSTFLGVSAGGYVPVPLYPPADLRKLDAYLPHTRHILTAAAAKAVITTAPIRRLLGTVRAETPGLRGIFLDEDLDGPARSGIERVSLSDTVLLQFTSGSTSTPKGVVLTHENLDANVSALGGPQGIAATSADIGVSWLPLFHDMGLIGMALGSVYFGVSTTLMSPMVFLRRPASWLQAISERRGTISFAPNFAYSFCTRRVKDAELEGLDLSSWRVAGCGAEPIHPAVLEAFTRRFAAAGFRETAWLPCYGMAEHTLAVTFPERGTPLRVDTVDAFDLALRNVAVPVSRSSERAISFVCCGRPFPQHAVRVVDEEDRPVEGRTVGEIVLAGPSVMKGYEGLPELTQEALRGGFLHTGDLGYLVDGELYVCGRKKDMIIVNGRNYYPQDVEWAVGDLPGLRRGSVVAFGTNAFRGGERLVVVVEAKAAVVVEEVSREIRRRVLTRVGLRVHEVVVAPPGTISKTSSGKPQRFRTKAKYEDGSLLEEAGRGGGLLGHLVTSQWGHLRAAFREHILRER